MLVLDESGGQLLVDVTVPAQRGRGLCPQARVSTAQMAASTSSPHGGLRGLIHGAATPAAIASGQPASWGADRQVVSRQWGT
jgi:hypothetical protein